ncbi:hypothetical protein CPB84DRAFT_1771918 [Gymnopilus junonius]|uniref:Uncharacterized protein n=1 Tax=Gymnopilus junonius TaxID=109634 RepID=A0A9P5NSJ8_GYMJU|nr:hypothetical protein CPB84DRAFT_1771918 [Gymnopilus junonius]
MAEQAKSAPATQEHPYPPPTLVPYPQQVYNGAPYPPPGPPGAYMPPMFAYPPPPDGSHPEGAQHGVPPAPYMIGLPPGLVYAYPPHPQAQGPSFLSFASYHHPNPFSHSHVAFGPPPTNSSAPPALTRPKRKQVKMAVSFSAFSTSRV